MLGKPHVCSLCEGCFRVTAHKYWGNTGLVSDNCTYSYTFPDKTGLRTVPGLLQLQMALELFLPLEIGSLYMAQAGLELLLLLPSPTECWGNR